MRVKSIHGFVTGAAGALIGLSVIDYIKTYGVFTGLSIQDAFQHIVVFGLGVILLALSALITLICDR